jgi:tetratricopeptide (TPR) repeat protein
MDATGGDGCLPGAVGLAVAGCTLGYYLAEQRVAAGDEALQDRELDAALAEFEEAVRLDPTHHDAHYKLGLVYKEKGDWNAAAAALQEAVRLNAERLEPIFELGEVYRLLNKMTQAIRAYTLASDLAPNNFDVHFRLASCYHQVGQLDQAVAAYEDAIRIEPGNAYVRSNLGAVFAAQGKPYEAIRAYKESLECNEAQPIVLVNLATVYLNQQRWETARRVLDKAIELAPDLSSAHERLGYCLWRTQSYDASAASYQRAIECDRKNAAAFAGHGVVLMTQYLDQPENVALRDRAVENWHISLELAPNQPKLRELVDKYRPKVEKPPLPLEP